MKPCLEVLCRNKETEGVLEIEVGFIRMLLSIYIVYS